MKLNPFSKSKPTATANDASTDSSSLEKVDTQKDGISKTGEKADGTSATVSRTTSRQEQLVRTISIPGIGEVPDNIEYPQGAKLLVIMISLGLSVFLMALDNTIIATAIPRITDDFKALNDVGWYGSAYLLTTCAFQLLFGKLYTFFSIKWVYLTAIFIFEVGSAVCGAAPDSVSLIIGRAVAGVGSAGIFSGALVIIAYSVPLVKRPIYTGLIGAMYGMASVVG